jgi:hypothetical protein
MLHIATTYKHEPEALPVLCFPYITNKRMIFAPEASTENTVATTQPVEIVQPNDNLLGEVFIFSKSVFSEKRQ